MKASDLIAIALRLMALYLVLIALETALQQVMLFNQDIGDVFSGAYLAMVFVGLLQTATPLLAGLVLFNFPRTIARWLLPGDSDLPIAIGMTGDELQTAAFCILGVYLVAIGIPDVLSYATWIVYIVQDGADSPYDLPETLLNGLQASVELGIGLALCIRAEALRQLIGRFRTAGVAQD